MTPPPFLIGGALIFWGIYADMVLPALACALILESPRWTGWRIEIRETEVRRVWLLTCLILLSVITVSFVDLGGLMMFSRSALYAPLIFFPLALVQAFHKRSALEFQMLFLKPSRRKSLTGNPPLAVNWLYLYLILVLISTGLQARGALSFEGDLVSALNESRFYLGAMVLLGLAFWKFRPDHISSKAWVVLYLFSGILGMLGNFGIQAAQEIIDREVIQFMMKQMQKNRDPFKTSTAIGHLGELKLYGSILFRVQQVKGDKERFLLAQNGYTIYRSPNWLAPRGGFRPVHPQSGGLTWQFGPNTDPQQILKIISPIDNGSGFLPLPLTTSSLGPLPAGNVLKNWQGGLLVQGTPEWAQFFVKAGDKPFLQGPPNEADRSIPPRLLEVLRPSLNKLQLKKVPDSEKPKRLNRFFESGFTYALKGTGAPEGVDPLHYFLNQSHAGHCEYFATATTLLLRAAGIPARYMVGYSVHERDPFNNQFIVRLRNAHSWTLAWLDGQWVEIDSTPPSWIEIENRQASSLEWIGDFWSRVKMVFVEWKWFQEEEGQYYQVMLLLLGIFMLALGWKITRRTRFNRLKEQPDENGFYYPASKPSPFSKIENYLEPVIGQRLPDETYRVWLEKLLKEEGKKPLQKSLMPILNQHYSWRFDPECDEPINEVKLERAVEEWLRKQVTLETPEKK